MQCAQHPSDAAPPSGVCASCLAERLTDLLKLQHDRFLQLPFSQPLPITSPPSQDSESDRIRRTQSIVGNHQFKPQKPTKGKNKNSILARFKHTKEKKKKENGNEELNCEETHKPRAISSWISAFLLPRRHRDKKTHMPGKTATIDDSNDTIVAAHDVNMDKNHRNMVSDYEAVSFQSMNSRAVANEVGGYYSDSDLTKRGGGGADARIFPRVKRRVENPNPNPMVVGSCSSTTARVNLFSESESDEESGRSSPRVDGIRGGQCNGYFGGDFRSPSPKVKGYWKGSYPDCSGSFSPYTDRKLQSGRPFSMAQRENSGFAFCLTPGKMFHREISRSPRRGGKKLSNFFFSPSRRMN